MGEPINAATYKAARETCGISHQTVSQALGASVTTQRIWEEGGQEVPQEAAAWMMARLVEHEQAVNEAVEAFFQIETRAKKEYGKLYKPKTIDIAYYRDQEEYDKYGRDPGDVGIVNARARAIAERLRDLGYEVAMHYPEEKAASYASDLTRD